MAGLAKATLCALVVSLTPIATRADTLADAMVGAYTTSGLLEQNRALLRAADEDVAAATGALLPIVNYTARMSRSFGERQTGTFVTDLDGDQASFNIVAELLLYDFGATANTIEARKETVLATRQQLVSIEQSVLLRAVSAFMSVRFREEFVTLQQNNLRVLTQELRAAQDRFEVGEVTRTDVALAESRLAEANSRLATAQGNLLQAIEEYRNVVGRAPGRLVTPPNLPRIGDSVETAKALAVRTHPDLRAVQHQVAAAELTILSAKAAVNPSISANTQFNLTENIDSSDFARSGSIGIELSGPIYQGGRISSGVRRAIAARDAQRGNLHAVQRNVVQDVGNAYADLAAQRSSLQATEGRIKAARIAFEGVREEAKLGARTTLDVLDAEQEALDAEAARISAQANLYIAAYRVLQSTGRLTVKDLGLPVPQYDPAAYYDLVKDAPTANSRQGQQLDKVLRALQKE